MLFINNNNSRNNFSYNSVNDYLHSHNYLNGLNDEQLKIIQINMRSIRSFERFDIFKNLLDEFKTELDVVIISAGWISLRFNIIIAFPDMKVFSMVVIMDPQVEAWQFLLKDL